MGILKQLLEDMQGDLKEATDAENAAISEFEGLVAAKEKEIQAATEAIESKLERKGQLAVEIVNKKNDLDDAKESLAEDQKFLADLKKDCATKEKEFEERKAARAEELVAISETIKARGGDQSSRVKEAGRGGQLLAWPTAGWCSARLGFLFYFAWDFQTGCESRREHLFALALRRSSTMTTLLTCPWGQIVVWGSRGKLSGGK